MSRGVRSEEGWGHGWWLRDAKKMSKSVGNVVRPDRLVAEFGPEALRYFLLREMAFGQDANFSDQAFLERYNADLANDLGNTVSRVAALCRQAFGTSPPESCDDNEMTAAWDRARTDWRAAMDDFAFNRGLEAIWRFLSEINGYVVAREPEIRRRRDSPRLSRVLYSARRVRLAAALLSPSRRRRPGSLRAPRARKTPARDLDGGRAADFGASRPAGRSFPVRPAAYCSTGEKDDD